MKRVTEEIGEADNGIKAEITLMNYCLAMVGNFCFN